MDAYFNAMKIKFNDLNTITENIFEHTHIKTVNLFINLEDINSRFQNVRMNKEFQCCGAGAFKQYASNVFNLIGHYKQWLNRLKVIPKIYVYYTTATAGFTSTSLIPGYRSKYVERCSQLNADCYYVNNTIVAADAVLKDIYPFINGVYFIDSKGEEPSAIPYLISQEKPADWNFVLTKDRVDLQYCLYDKFSILYPSSTYGPQLVNSGNLWVFIAQKEYIASPHIAQFEPKLYFTILGIVGNARRGVNKLKRIGWKTIFDYLDEVWEKDGDHSLFTMIDAIEDKIDSKGQDVVDQFMNNMLALSMKSRYEAMSKASKELIMMQIVDTPDIESLQQINRDPMIFGNYPMNLKFLTEEMSTGNRPDWNSITHKK